MNRRVGTRNRSAPGTTPEFWRRAAGLGMAFGLLMTGCAVGPNYQPPRTTVPTVFANASGTNLLATPVPMEWWRDFHDSLLDGLVARGLTNNHDLRIARATLREARALRRLAQFDLLPVINGQAGYQKSRRSQQAAPLFPGAALDTDLYDAGFDATWELDFFGRVRRSIEANSAEVQAALANQDAVTLSLVSELVRNYLELRGGQNQLAVARRNAENQRETLRITQARLEGGRGTELDIARARAQLSSTLAGVPPLETEVARATHRLSVLVGEQPSAIAEQLATEAPLPNPPAELAVSDPESLLRRRPDVRLAERRLAAATARIGIATADLFPRVVFNGRVALEATSFSGLGERGAETWSFGPRITWAALDLGHVRARIKAAGARADAALAYYEQTVLTSLEETENALVEFGREKARRGFLQESVDASQLAATLARQRFEAGASDFLTVLDAERVLLAAQDQLAQSQTRTATALVSVYKALGAR